MNFWVPLPIKTHIDKDGYCSDSWKLECVSYHVYKKLLFIVSIDVDAYKEMCFLIIILYVREKSILQQARDNDPDGILLRNYLNKNILKWNKKLSNLILLEDNISEQIW